LGNSALPVSGGSGHNVSTWSRTKSATTYKEQITLPGEYHENTYFVSALDVSAANTGDGLLQIMAASGTYTRIRGIWVHEAALGGAANALAVDIIRITTAGTGGTTVTARPHDSGDSAFGGACMSGIASANSGTEGVTLRRGRLAVVAAQPVNMDSSWSWIQHPLTKPIIIPAGTSNGIEIKNVVGRASVTVDIHVELVETSWLGAT
jgi:hypothetical protein